MRKRVIRIIMGYGYREFCRELFKELKILPLSSQYIFSLLLFVVSNRDYLVLNSVYYNVNTRQLFAFAMYQKGVYYSVKNFNGLTKAIKNIPSKPKKFKIDLKHFLHMHAFYRLD